MRVVPYVALVALAMAEACGSGSHRDGVPDTTGGGTPDPSAPPAPPPPPPATPPESLPGAVEPDIVWERRLGGGGDEFVADVATDSGGTTALTWIGGAPWTTTNKPVPHALGLVRLNEGGEIVWARELPNPHETDVYGISIASVRDGTILGLHTGCTPAGCMDLGMGPIRGSAIVKFDATGSAVWQSAVDGTLASDVAADRRGRAAVASRRSTGETRLGMYDEAGVLLWNVEGPFSTRRFALALDADGNVFVGAGLALLALDRTGRIRWSADFAPEPGTAGHLATVGVSADGVVATLTFYGALSYAGTRIECRQAGGCSAAIVADTDGKPRLARMVPAVWIQDAAVSPGGALAIATWNDGACTGELYYLAQIAERPRRVRLACRSGSDEWFGATSVAIVPPTGDVVVAGAFLPEEPADADGMLRSIRP